MSTKYFIKQIETCPKCEGRQFVQHPAWSEYWEDPNNQTPKTVDEDRKWFEDHGWYTGSQLDIRTDNHLPDEEITCNECEGEGEIVSEANLIDVLRELLPTLVSELSSISTSAEVKA